MADNLQLLRLAKEGDDTARTRLITENMGLVVCIAKRYIGRGQELEDLIQIGLIGLIKAVDRFDMGYDVKFSTYSVPLIQGEIRRFLRDDGLVKVSRSLKTIHYKAEIFCREFQRAHGREPAIDEICEAIGSTESELVMAMESSVEVSNIDDMTEVQYNRREEESVIEKLYVGQLLDTLSEKEKRLITLRYFAEKTQAETGRIMGISQVQVSRLERKILDNLNKLT